MATDSVARRFRSSLTGDGCCLRFIVATVCTATLQELLRVNRAKVGVMKSLRRSCLQLVDALTKLLVLTDEAIFRSFRAGLSKAIARVQLPSS